MGLSGGGSSPGWDQVVSPVQPGQKVFGGSDQIHHAREEVVGQPSTHPAVVVAAAPPARDEVLQVFSGGVELMGERAQVLRLQTVVL